jgi:REP-associated tyrosine transposase
MARMARFKMEKAAAWYHLHAQAAGKSGEYPLEDAGCKRKLIALLKHWSRAYFCQVVAFCVMGNHWHIVLHFDAPEKLSSDELLRHARVFYPGGKGRELLESWTKADWARFAKRIFDVSEFMRNVQGEFATWYNRTFDRKGRFWADRFKSTVLEDERAVLDCMMYVELNPVRAGLVEKPEAYQSSSCFLRSIGKGEWLVKIRELLDAPSEKKARADYRYLLIWRGSVPTKDGQVRIPEGLAEREAERGFSKSGAFLQRLRYFSDGVVVGSEVFVRQQLTRLRRAGLYKRRCNPLPQSEGPHFSLREQRSHAVHI